MRRCVGRATVVAAVLGGVGCRASAPPAPAAPVVAAPARPALEVEKVREDLQVTPLEVVFSGVRGEARGEENVGIRNTGGAPVILSALEIVGPDARIFAIATAPKLPLTLVPTAQISVAVAFVPGADSEPGVHRASLHVLIGPKREEGPPVDLCGLVLQGKQGDREPPLQQVIEALGFVVDVGRTGLHLGTAAELMGDEIKVPRFRRARTSPVSAYPVARFSGGERAPYGYYQVGKSMQLHPLAAIAAGQDQTLNPDLEPDGRTTFDPGDRVFGLYVKPGKLTLFSEDPLNTGAIRHAARVYPLKSRGGGRIADAYLVAFEETTDGDYQDHVFVVWNVKPAE